MVATIVYINFETCEEILRLESSNPIVPEIGSRVEITYFAFQVRDVVHCVGSNRHRIEVRLNQL